VGEPTQLFYLVVVVLAARVAAEVAERTRVPGVVAEIVTGMVIGPSVLGLVGSSDVLSFLAEIGAILLLFEVGRQTDVADLRSVGGSSLRVALIGVVTPLALAIAALVAVGSDLTVALFLAGGLTATSVAVTARTFAEMRSLGSPTARIVLGAAVLDDVLGLVVLTVTSRAATAGGSGVAGMAALFVAILPAAAFLAVAVILGRRAIPHALERLSARSRTEGTILALGLATALAFAAGAWATGLAPIVGAFVAGTAVAQNRVASDLHVRLTPLGHVFVPLFFLGVGIQLDPRVFADPSALGLVALLSVIAVLGKLVSGVGATRDAGDRVAVGIAMIPRGEVGLVFAGVGLSSGVLDADHYAALVGVVLLTSVLGPWWLRGRGVRVPRSDQSARSQHASFPPEGWLRIDGEVELTAIPPARIEARVALDAAVACSARRPGPGLVRWLSAAAGPVGWNDEVRRSLDRLLASGNARSWRLLEMTSFLGRLLPGVDTAVRRLPHDPFALEPVGSIPLGVLEGLNDLVRSDEANGIWSGLTADARADLRLTALALSVDAGAEGAAAIARSTGLPDGRSDAIGRLVADRHLLRSAARRTGTASRGNLLELAMHLGSPERVDASFLLALAEGVGGAIQREQLAELRERLFELVPAHPDQRSLGETAELRRREAARLRDARSGQAILRHAPDDYLLAHEADAVARHVRLLEPPPDGDEVRLEAETAPAGGGCWRVHLVAQDRTGLLVAVAGTLARHELSVRGADLAVWRSGVAIQVLEVEAGSDTIDWERVRKEIGAGRPTELRPGPIDAAVEVDRLASPTRTVVEMLARDRVGLLARVAAAFDRAGVRIHRATVTTQDEIAVDTFWVSGPRGGKLTPVDEAALRAALAGGSPRRVRWLRHPA
jgi:Na+:H+ antiporter